MRLFAAKLILSKQQKYELRSNLIYFLIFSFLPKMFNIRKQNKTWQLNSLSLISIDHKGSIHRLLKPGLGILFELGPKCVSARSERLNKQTPFLEEKVCYGTFASWLAHKFACNVIRKISESTMRKVNCFECCHT